MESLSTVVQSPFLAAIASPIVVMALAAFFWWRAGSIHSMLERLWRLVAGKAEVEDPALKKLMQETRDLERFRFVYGLRIESMSDLQCLMSWMKRHDISIVKLQKAKPWIDIASAELVRKPTSRYVIGCFASIVICCVLITVALHLFTATDVLLKMRESEVWFRTDGYSVRTIWGTRLATLNSCTENIEALAKSTGFSSDEASVLCTSFGEKSLHKLVQQEVRNQQWLFGGLATLFFVLLGLRFLKLRAAAEAVEIRKKMDKKLEIRQSRDKGIVGAAANLTADAPAKLS
ncbi:hypothetical protein E5S69_21015 [Cupriavidus necator]|uniref:DUF6216 family protein n=1 Tax=Cupriavidus necator TaxID=106590 RepID=UPI0014900231|nr:DUF6216 family protein [Cupriavidus necator]NOV25988.1 hypothetical protein [Cupriavidus necator]